MKCSIEKLIIYSVHVSTICWNCFKKSRHKSTIGVRCLLLWTRTKFMTPLKNHCSIICLEAVVAILGSPPSVDKAKGDIQIFEGCTKKIIPGSAYHYAGGECTVQWRQVMSYNIFTISELKICFRNFVYPYSFSFFIYYSYIKHI